MNKAFVKEPSNDGLDEDDDAGGPPPLPAGTRNYLTPQGYQRLRDELISPCRLSASSMPLKVTVRSSPRAVA